MKKQGEFEDRGTFFTPGLIPHDADVRIALQNLDEFLDYFSINKAAKERGYLSPFKILANLEDSVMTDYLRYGSIDEMYSASYRIDGWSDAIFEFERYNYDAARKLVVIEFSYNTTLS